MVGGPPWRCRGGGWRASPGAGGVPGCSHRRILGSRGFFAAGCKSLSALEPTRQHRAHRGLGGVAGKGWRSRGRCFIWLKPSPSPSCRAGIRSTARRRRSPLVLVFSFLFLVVRRFSFLRFPWASPGYFWNRPFSVLAFTISSLFFSSPIPPRGRVRAPALGLLFAAFNENSAEAIYIFFKQMK